MANTYTWSVESLYALPFLNGQANVISLVNWVVTGKNGVNTSIVRGLQPLSYTAGHPFTPYVALSENTVIEWVKETMGKDKVAEIEKQLDAQMANIIARAKNDLLVKNPLPWAEK